MLWRAKGPVKAPKETPYIRVSSLGTVFTTQFGNLTGFSLFVRFVWGRGVVAQGQIRGQCLWFGSYLSPSFTLLKISRMSGGFCCTPSMGVDWEVKVLYGG